MPTCMVEEYKMAQGGNSRFYGLVDEMSGWIHLATSSRSQGQDQDSNQKLAILKAVNSQFCKNNYNNVKSIMAWVCMPSHYLKYKDHFQIQKGGQKVRKGAGRMGRIFSWVNNPRWMGHCGLGTLLSWSVFRVSRAKYRLSTFRYANPGDSGLL
ncbi:hypothetical protein THAOC_21214 [Thalassiosira oceanica]|uniref:Uncharacterized protein n=1 Tax=Thalassiosira oceanica TaxID=159749 RepID=K0SJK8_THAOC|nr:hypothetical protein THAOC_21214 [Thalassiosira oceanica]|eukprot:EJK58642.1 hypothetical protein THAOC_21214 [Thalassiosira oceanica]